MNKWTKAILILAVVLILVGGVMTVICKVLGASWSDANVEFGSAERSDHVTDSDSTDAEETQVWTFDGQQIRSISLEVDAGEMKLQTGDGFRVEVKNARDGMKCQIKDGVLTVEEEEHGSLFHIGSVQIGENGITAGHPVITVIIPEQAVFEKAEISVGAGSIKADTLTAGEVKIDVDAGYFSCQSLKADRNCKIDVNAGSAEIRGGFCTGKTEVDVDAGAVLLADFAAEGAVFSVNAGSVEYEGILRGDWEADCDVGSIEMKLEGLETDYNYTVSSDLGSIRIGNQKFSGLSGDRKLENAALYHARLDCDLGSIEVNFEK